MHKTTKLMRHPSFNDCLVKVNTIQATDISSIMLGMIKLYETTMSSWLTWTELYCPHGITHLFISRRVVASCIAWWEIDEVVSTTDGLKHIRYTVTVHVACSSQVHLSQCPRQSTGNTRKHRQSYRHADPRRQWPQVA